MRTKWCVWFVVVLFGAIGSAAQRGAPGEPFLSTWAGTWAGEGSGGGLELMLERGEDGQLGGGVSVTGEPTYKATLRTVSFDGARMTAKYDFPPDQAAEVALAATFDGETAKGTWSARLKANDEELARGTWTATRKSGVRS